jgi:hypothetical protein
MYTVLCNMERNHKNCKTKFYFHYNHEKNFNVLIVDSYISVIEYKMGPFLAIQ